MSLPLKFIDGEPPGRSHNTKGSLPSALIIGALMTRPGVWAIIDPEDTDPRSGSQKAHKIRQYSEANDLNCEAVCRDGVGYARWLGDDQAAEL